MSFACPVSRSPWGVPNRVDHMGLWQRSPKVMKIGKSVYFIYPGFHQMLTVVMFTNEFHYYLKDMVDTACSIQFQGVCKNVAQIGIWPKGHES